MNPQSDDSAKARRLDEILNGYRKAIDAGTAMPRSDLIEEHPEFASELAAFFAASSSGQSKAPLGAMVHYFGDYELVEEIARGGMGVVYQARQVSLNRAVALKMIKTGLLASPDDIRRFRTEAEAAANLNHANIVPIYEVGEHHGQHYFSMKLIEGGSLSQQVAGLVNEPKVAAALLATVAQAVHHAHQRGILHRDLKPSNILLDADGQPLVMDFGLAKRIEGDTRLTQSGAIVGSPSYMAPEQARAERSLTTAVDIYGLGAVLYELLTGQPPYRASTALETVLQLLEREPQRPRSLNTHVNADLETICLRCLEREPEKRYTSAAELAADLRRFVEGRPILARPVGQVERTVKWVRRNRAPAGMGAVVALLLIGAAVISTVFRFEEKEQARQAHENRADAIEKEKQIARANEDLHRSLDDLRIAVARGWLRPLALPNEEWPVHDAEWDAIWDLARNRTGTLGVQFIAEATLAPTTIQKLRNRAGLALPAAAGLDEERRSSIEKILSASLADSNLGFEQKTDIAMALSMWDGASPSSAFAAGQQIAEAMETAEGSLVQMLLARRLSALARHMEAQDAGSTAAQAMSALLKKTRNSKNDDLPLEALSTVASNLTPKDAAMVVAELTQLIKVIKDESEFSRWEELSNCLAAVAGRLDSEDVARAAAPFLEMLVKSLESDTVRRLAENISNFTKRMSSVDAASAKSQIAKQFVRALKAASDPLSRSAAAAQMVEAAPFMDAKEAAPVFATLLGLLKNEFPNSLDRLEPSLASLALRLDPADAAQCVAALMKMLKEAKEPNQVAGLAKIVSALARRMEAKDAAIAAADFVQFVNDHRGSWALSHLADGLSAMAARMDAREALPLLTLMMDGVVSSELWDSLASSYAAKASQVQGKEAAQAAATLVQMMRSSQNPKSLESLANGFDSLAARLEPEDAVRIVPALMTLLKENQDTDRTDLKLSSTRDDLNWLVHSLSVLSARLTPKDAALAAEVLLKSLNEVKKYQAVPQMARILLGLAARLESKDAGPIADRAAAILTGFMGRAEVGQLIPLAIGVALLAGPMEKASAATACKRAATVLLEFRKSFYDYSAWLAAVAEGLPALTPHLDAREAAHAAARLVQFMHDATRSEEFSSLARGLVGVAANMEVQDVDWAAAAIVRAMRLSLDPQILDGMARGLSAVADRLEPRKAAVVIAEAAATLIEIEAGAVHPMEVSLSMLTLVRVLETSKQKGTRPGPMPNPLATLLAADAFTNMTKRASTVAAALAFGADPCQALAALPVFLQVAKPAPCRLSTQQLIDLLKMPTCIAETRRMLLDRLGDRYQRYFADSWEFVHFAKENRIELDFTSPPQRPEPIAREP